MSSFITKAKYKKTGEIFDVFCIDDYFGRHRYGYKPEKQSAVLNEEEFGEQYERVKGNGDEGS